MFRTTEQPVFLSTLNSSEINKLNQDQLTLEKDSDSFTATWCRFFLATL